MLTAKIKIGDGAILDSRDRSEDGDGLRGLVYLDSDKVTAAPSKEFESTSYPEEEGVHILPKTVDDSFEYKVKFFIQADTLESANAKITAFNESLYTQQSGSDVKEYKQVTFFNLYKRHKIVGYPLPISEATQFWRDKTNQVNDVVVVEWTIRVNKPSLCNFNDTSD